MQTITLEVPQDTLDAARLTVAELKLEIAIALYAQGRLSIGKARELADMPLWTFRHILAARQIPPHLAPDDVDADVATLQALGRL